MKIMVDHCSGRKEKLNVEKVKEHEFLTFANKVTVPLNEAKFNFFFNLFSRR